MYKWPQGRIVRIVCLLLTALVTFDLAYNGAYGPLTAGEGTKQFVVGVVFCVLAFAALVAGLVAAGFHQRAVDFLIEVEQEMVRVEWPATNALIRSTLIIAVAIAVMAVMILGVDALNLYFLDFVRYLGSKL
jgi:preprotein translocase SecE subunit